MADSPIYDNPFEIVYESTKYPTAPNPAAPVGTRATEAYEVYPSAEERVLLLCSAEAR